MNKEITPQASTVFTRILLVVFLPFDCSIFNNSQEDCFTLYALINHISDLAIYDLFRYDHER